MSNAASSSPAGATVTQDASQEAAAATKKTPGTDMQADDAGTAESGVESGTGTAAESAMKQTSKTDAETGSQR